MRNQYYSILDSKNNEIIESKFERKNKEKNKKIKIEEKKNSNSSSNDEYDEKNKKKEYQKKFLLKASPEKKNH